LGFAHIKAAHKTVVKLTPERLSGKISNTVREESRKGCANEDVKKERQSHAKSQTILSKRKHLEKQKKWEQKRLFNR